MQGPGLVHVVGVGAAVIAQPDAVVLHLLNQLQAAPRTGCYYYYFQYYYYYCLGLGFRV